jgi:hypothetical protein
MSYFTGEDLIFHHDNDTGKIISGGYNINSILLKEGISPMATFNTQNGGKVLDNNNISTLFDNLAVPAGLFYYDQKAGFKDNSIEYNKSDYISEDLHDKLFKLVEVTNKKNKAKTYKVQNKILKKNTKKNI